jgi:hypothetical protein
LIDKLGRKIFISGEVYRKPPGIVTIKLELLKVLYRSC